MASDTDILDYQRTYKAHAEYSAAKPEWMSLATKAINAWGRREATLQQAVAEALEAAYAAGVAGEYPEPPAPPVNHTIRRTRPAPAPEAAPTVQRVGRTRPTPQIRTVIRRTR